MGNVVLHQDFDGFYASVEELYHPEYKGRPLVVGGDAEQRHGIILSKNQLAKKTGIKTGEVLWQAKQKCPDLVIIKPRFEMYKRFSTKGHDILNSYSGYIQPYGLDESWLQMNDIDIPEGARIAQEIRERAIEELGISTSIGISYNRVFAKLGSDQRKPNGQFTVTEDDYKEKVWPLPAKDLIMVGQQTYKKLLKIQFTTIGHIARADLDFMRYYLKMYGVMLWGFANGLELTPVTEAGYTRREKSIGNSSTCPRDLVCDEDVRIMLTILTQSVSARMIKADLTGDVVSIYVRSNDLTSFTRQRKIKRTTQLPDVILNNAMELFLENYHWEKPIRSIGVRVSNLKSVYDPAQLSMFDAPIDEGYKGIEELYLEEDKKRHLNTVIMDMHARFGNKSVVLGTELLDKQLSRLDPERENTIHPEGYLVGDI